MVAGYVVVGSLINHPVLLAAGFRWANFDFRSGVRPSCAYHTSLILYIVYLSRSVLVDRCVVVAAAAWSRWRWGRGPFVRSANVIYHEAIRSGEGGAHSSRTHTYTVTGNVFFTLTKWKKTSACVGGGKFDLKLTYVKNTFRKPRWGFFYFL